jgi:hypothetical protein
MIRVGRISQLLTTADHEIRTSFQTPNRELLSSKPKMQIAQEYIDRYQTAVLPVVLNTSKIGAIFFYNYGGETP